MAPGLAARLVANCPCLESPGEHRMAEYVFVTPEQVKAFHQGQLRVLETIGVRIEPF